MGLNDQDSGGLVTASCDNLGLQTHKVICTLSTSLKQFTNYPVFEMEYYIKTAIGKGATLSMVWKGS
jgi:hypothetical protein